MKLILLFLYTTVLLSASTQNTNIYTLNEAIEILKTNNLEIKSAALDVASAKEEQQTATGANWGKLEFIQDFARSNDAGNVFGFKLTSREATFGDFGFSEFNPALPQNILLKTQPNDLNYPDARNFFQSKLKYEIPLFTGFAISSYSSVLENMIKIKKLSKDEVINEKIYQIRKSYYDMALLDESIAHLEVVLSNINTLEDTTQSMIDVGYAKKVDLLEVKAKKGNVERLLLQMNSNKKLLLHFISFLLNQHIIQIMAPSSEVVMPSYTDKEILSHNIDIQKASTALEINHNMVRVSQAAYYPTVGAFAEVATADNSFLGNANDHSAYTVGARVSWNLFNGGIDSAKVQKAKIDTLRMNSQVALAKKGIALKLAKIRTEIVTINAKVISLENELELVNAIYKNYEGRYKEKLSSMSDVIIKQSAQIQKILELQKAKNERNEKIFALENLANINE